MKKKNVYDKIKEEEEKVKEENKLRKSPDIKAMFSQRVLAFLIDLVLISMITSLITMFVPVNDTATKLYEEQNRVLEGYVGQCEKFYGKLDILDENDIEMKILIQNYQKGSKLFFEKQN